MTAHWFNGTGHPDWRYTLDDFKSDDESMATCLGLARIAARIDLPILILGETGTGKTMLARAIHNSSRRAASPFIAFNSSALSDTLLDSQLFGHEKGAFTGAIKRVKGKFEQADTGTLFLDEIADMSAAGQAKILRAVEYGEFERLGGESLQEADVRLISATHLPIARYLATDHFRKDLFYRISGITLRLPPLCERPKDLRTIMAAAIAAASRAQDKSIVGLSREAADQLLQYPWPGNLRQLQRVIHTAVAITEGEIIEPDAILLETSVEEVRAEDAAAPPAATGSNALDDDDLSLRAAEARHIHQVLDHFRGNKRRTARALGLSQRSCQRGNPDASGRSSFQYHGSIPGPLRGPIIEPFHLTAFARLFELVVSTSHPLRERFGTAIAFPWGRQNFAAASFTITGDAPWPPRRAQR